MLKLQVCAVGAVIRAEELQPVWSLRTTDSEHIIIHFTTTYRTRYRTRYRDQSRSEQGSQYGRQMLDWICVLFFILCVKFTFFKHISEVITLKAPHRFYMWIYPQLLCQVSSTCLYICFNLFVLWAIIMLLIHLLNIPSFSIFYTINITSSHYTSLCCLTNRSFLYVYCDQVNLYNTYHNLIPLMIQEDVESGSNWL